MTLMTREEVPEELTWDLSTLYKNKEEWEAAFIEIREGIPAVAKYRGTLHESAGNLLAFLQAMESLNRKLYNLVCYARCLSDQDTGNSEHSAMAQRAMQLASEEDGALSFAYPEMTNLDPEVVRGWMDEEPELKIYEHYFDNIFRQRPHILSDELEQALALAEPVFNGGMEAYQMLTNADLSFDSVQDKDGKEEVVTEGRLGRLLESPDRLLRQRAFDSIYKSYAQHRNTLASTLGTQVKRDNLEAKLRGFGDAREAALFNNAIPVAVHDTLIQEVNAHAELLHRYVALRKRLLGIQDLQPYDLYTSLLQEEPREYSYEEGQAIVLEALKPLGEDYLKVIQRAFDERWIDVMENKGKRGGAYSSGTYDSAPYILHNWSSTLGDVYTLAHELGHSLHSYLSGKNQPSYYSYYSIFLAEIASTTNENLLTYYLLSKSTSDQERAYILNRYLDGFKGTVFRQTQFAEFEHRIHQMDQAGQPLTPDALDQLYGEINKHYYGAALDENRNIAREWSRIPHFYYNYYVYQYATGFSAATAFAQLIFQEGQPAVDRYLGFLSAGSSDYPIEVLKRAGVDMTTPDPIVLGMQQFESYLTELESLIG